MQSAITYEGSIDIRGDVPFGEYYLADSVEMVDCKTILEES